MKNFLLAFVLIFVATAAHAATAIEPSFNTAICVGNGGSTQGGQVINSYICSNATSQSFTFTALANGFYTISPNNNSSLCLDAGQGSVTVGSLVEQNPCISGQTGQEWQVISNAGQSYSFLTMNGQGTLTVAGTYIGAPLTTAQPAGSNTQQFSLPGFGSAPPPPPTVSLSASPTSVISGGSTTLAWSSTNATACTASNGWSGAEATSGTQALNNLTTTTTYTLTCTGAGGSANQSVTVTVAADTTPPSIPTNLAGTAVSRSQIHLTWTASTDNVGVTGYKSFRNGVQIAASTANSFSDTGLTANTTYSYTVSAYDAAGNNSAQSSSVSVTTQSASTSGGGTSAIEPSFNTAICVANGGSSQGGQVLYTLQCNNGSSQSFVFTPTSDGFYTIGTNNNSSLCVDAGYGSVTTGSQVQQISCSAGTPSQKWQVVLNANQFYSILTMNGQGTLTVSGTYVGAPLITMGLVAGSTSQEFVLPGFGAAPPPPTVSLSASPTSVISGGSTTLAWSSTNATACTASNGWSGAEATSGTQALNNLTTTTTYTLTCTGAGGSANQSVTVTVAQPSIPVTTYHYDNLRTGWNNQETTLTATNFPSAFGILQTVMLDDQVDAQPLIVPGRTIAGGTHDVVYVATESNTIYGIDASSGAIILQRNLGSPVPAPLACNNNGPNVGINSTPVIDLSANALYVIAYVNNPRPTYILHALNLTDLTDKPGSPVTVAASHTLTNGSTFTFNAQYQRQRPALLELNGNIYAGFGSFCDFQANNSRGWLLGWGGQTLVPLPANELDDTQATSPDNFFLSSIWMSGYGIAGTGTALYFSTGNSDAGTYDGTTNIQESVVTLSNQLGLLGTFTPSNVADLDKYDVDLGSGGVLLLPSQGGSFPDLAVTAGKDGRLFLLNRDAMQSSGFNSAAALDTHQLSGCWCGPSFFMGSDGIGRVVTSAGSGLNTWQLQLSPSPKLVQEGTATIPTSSQDPGFFTVVSSNSTNAGTAIIWAVGRPVTTTAVTLYAFAATVSGGTYQLLFSSPAGSWPYTGGNANIVPVVANGKVYVASYQALTIFGIPSNAPQVSAAPQIASPLPVPPVAPSSPHQITGTLLAINGPTLTLQTRAGKTVSIDGSKAAKNKQFAVLGLGKPYTVQGSSFDAIGTLQAISISRAKDSSALWPSDH